VKETKKNINEFHCIILGIVGGLLFDKKHKNLSLTEKMMIMNFLAKRIKISHEEK